MTPALQGKRILLVGAAGGIGRATARQLLAQGARVIVSDKKKFTPPKSKNKIVQHLADLRDESQVQDLCARAAQQWNGLDGVVNCAAVLDPEDGAPTRTTLKAWQATMEVNLNGAFLLCKHALPHLAKQKGSIVNLSSVVATHGSAQAQLAYTASKGGIEAMTREIAIAYAKKEVRANCVAPGLIQTPRTRPYLTPPQWKKRKPHIPQSRPGTPKEVATAITFLLGDGASYITGATLAVDGGVSAAYVAG